MDDARKEQFFLYARLKKERKLLDERLLELQAVLLPTMLEIGDTDAKVETELGNFSIKVTKNWTYPQELVDREDALKRDKKTAQQTGAATFEESPTLYFRSKDSEE